MGTRNSFGGNAVHRKGLAEGARTALCLFMAAGMLILSVIYLMNLGIALWVLSVTFRKEENK